MFNTKCTVIVSEPRFRKGTNYVKELFVQEKYLQNYTVKNKRIERPLQNYFN